MVIIIFLRFLSVLLFGQSARDLLHFLHILLLLFRILNYVECTNKFLPSHPQVRQQHRKHLSDLALPATLQLSDVDSYGTILTGQSADGAGFAVSGAGDVNNDGYPDFVIGGI